MLASLFAIDQPKLIGNAGIVRSQLRSLLQPLFRRGKISLSEICVAKIISRVWKGWFGCGLGQISNGAGVLVIVQIQSSQVIEDVRMISHFVAYELKLVTGFVGFVQFEEGYGERKSCPQAQFGSGRQSGPKFGDRCIVAVKFQGVVSLAQMGLWRLRWGRRRFLGYSVPEGKEDQGQTRQAKQDSPRETLGTHRNIICGAGNVAQAPGPASDLRLCSN